MEDESAKRILIVGASGYLGRALTKYLLSDTDRALRLAGRSLNRVQEAAAATSGKEFAQRLECVRLDLEDASALRDAMRDVQLLVNATSRGPHNDGLLEAAVEAGADYIDAQIVNDFLKPGAKLVERVEQVGCCCVIQAGFHPGIPAALVRYGAIQMDEIKRAVVGATINPEHGILYSSGVDELMELFGDYLRHPSHYRYTKQAKAAAKMNFAFGFGEKKLYPMQMIEMEALPKMIPGLEQASLCISGSNWVADYVATPVMLLGAFLAPRMLAAPLGHLFCWSSRQFPKPPYGTVLQLDAEGLREHEKTKLRVSLFHADEYDLTAIPMVSMIKQMLSGHARRPGIHLMGHLCDPVTLLDDLQRMGIRIEQELTAIH